jgi:hypothetical protein
MIYYSQHKLVFMLVFSLNRQATSISTFSFLVKIKLTKQIVVNQNIHNTIDTTNNFVMFKMINVLLVFYLTY